MVRSRAEEGLFLTCGGRFLFVLLKASQTLLRSVLRAMVDTKVWVTKIKLDPVSNNLFFGHETPTLPYI